MPLAFSALNTWKFSSSRRPCPSARFLAALTASENAPTAWTYSPRVWADYTGKGPGPFVAICRSGAAARARYGFLDRGDADTAETGPRAGASLPRGGRRRRLQLDRLHERAVGRDVPRGKSHPLLPRRVERDLEALLPERRQVGGGDDLAIGGAAVGPDHPDEGEREGTIDVGGGGPGRAAPLARVRPDEHPPGGDEGVA